MPRGAHEDLLQGAPLIHLAMVTVQVSTFAQGVTGMTVTCSSGYANVVVDKWQGEQNSAGVSTKRYMKKCSSWWRAAH